VADRAARLGLGRPRTSRRFPVSHLAGRRARDVRGDRGDLCVVDLVRTGGDVTGAVALHLGSGAPAVIDARATVVATGGSLTGSDVTNDEIITFALPKK